MTAPNPLDSVPLCDAFDRADGPLGAHWTQDSIAVPGGPIAQIVNQQVASADAVNYAQQYWNAATFGADMAAIVTIAALPTANNTYAEIDIVTRRQSDGSRYEMQLWWDRYAAPMNNTARFAWFDAANTQHVLGASLTAVDVVAGDLVVAQAVGTALAMWRKRGGAWTELITIADGNVTGAGAAGMALYDDSGTFRVDAFSAGPPVIGPYAGDTAIYDAAGTTGGISGGTVQPGDTIYDSAGATGAISGGTVLPPDTTL